MTTHILHTPTSHGCDERDRTGRAWRAALAVSATAAFVAMPAAVATAAPAGDASYSATLGSLNDSGTSGDVSAMVSGNQLTVTMNVTSASGGLPHAQHIHIGGNNTCPDMSADADADGFLSTPEGLPAYGAIEVSLTTEGDVGEASALAVDRMPVAGPDGTYTYERTFELPAGTDPAEIANGVVVVHGLADSTLGTDPAIYDGPDSPLMAGVPQEATLPVACGAFSAAQQPAGGAGDPLPATGSETVIMAALAGGLVLAGVGLQKLRSTGQPIS